MICSFQIKLFKEILDLVYHQMLPNIVFKKEMVKLFDDLSRSSVSFFLKSLRTSKKTENILIEP